MKAYCYLPVGIILLMPTLFSSAQDSLLTKGSYPFQKNNWSFPTATRIFNNYHYNHYIDQDVKFGKYNELDVALGFTYFFMNGFGAGLDIIEEYFDGYYGHQQTRRTLTIGAHISVGAKLTSNLNFLLTPEFSIVKKKFSYSFISGNDVVKKNDGIGYGITAEFPFRLCNGNSFLTPLLGYHRSSIDFDGGTEKLSGIKIGLGLQTYVTPDKYYWGSSGKKFNYNNYYDRGSWWIDFSTKGSFTSRNDKTDYENDIPTDEMKYTGTMLGINTNYEILNNLGLGIGLEYNRNKYTIGPEYGSKSNRFMAGPTLTFNAPFHGCLHHLFAKSGGQWGTETFELHNGTNIDKTKSKISKYSFGVGYNLPAGVNFSLPVSVNYEIENYQWTTSDQKYTTKGFGLNFGIRANF